MNNSGLDVPVELLRATAELSDDEFGLDLDNNFEKEAIDSALGPDHPKAPSSTNRTLEKPFADASQSAAHQTRAPGPVILSEFDDVNPMSGVPPRLAASVSGQRSTRRLLQVLQRIVIKPAHVVGGGLVVVLAGLAFILYASLSEQRDRPEPRYPVPAALLPGSRLQSGQNATPPPENSAANSSTASSGDISIAGAARPTLPRAASIPEKSTEPIHKAVEASSAQNLQNNVSHQSHAAVAQPLESIEYLLYTGSACEQRREYACALACCKKAAALRPSEYRLQNKVGSLLLSLALYADAQPYLAKALELNEDYTPALINMGIVHAKLDNYDSAERYLLRALALDGTNTDALHNMMLVCRKKGLYSLAATYGAKLNALGSATQKQGFQ